MEKRNSFELRPFKVMACIGTTFIRDGFQPSLRRIREAIWVDRPDVSAAIAHKIEAEG